MEAPAFRSLDSKRVKYFRLEHCEFLRRPAAGRECGRDKIAFRAI